VGVGRTGVVVNLLRDQEDYTMFEVKKTVSLFAVVVLFISDSVVAAGNDWYFHPRLDGPYGLNNGTTYNDAWYRDVDIKWGSGGIEAGDALYVCGMHDGGFQDRLIAVAASGSAGQPIIIDGACPSQPGVDCTGVTGKTEVCDPGEIFSTGVRITPNLWQGSLDTDGDGSPDVYFRTSVGQAAAIHNFEGDLAGNSVVPETIKRLDKFPCPLTAAAPGGSTCYDSDTLTVYYKPSSDNVTNHVFYTGGAAIITINNQSHVQVRNMRLRNSATAIIDLVNADHIRIENSDLKWAASVGIRVQADSDDGVIHNNRIDHTSNGIYLQSKTNADNNDRWNISHNVITNADQDGYYCNIDAHLIAVQGGIDHVIENNDVSKGAGSAIGFFTGSGMELRRVTVRYNKVHDIGRSLPDLCGIALNAGRLQTGIDFHKNNLNSPDNVEDNVAHHNLIWNVALEGIHTTSEYSALSVPWSFFNNTIYNAGTCFKWRGTDGNEDEISAGFSFSNNICLNSVNYHVFHDLLADTSGVALSNNLYYPDTVPYQFNYVVYNSLPAWQQATGKDQASIADNPWLVDPAQPDFRPVMGSPVMDRGTDVGLTTDIAGNAIGGAPEIGAYEILAPDLLPTSLSVSLSGNKIYVSDAALNQGNTPAGAFLVAYYLSTDTVFDPATDIPLAGSPNGSGACTRTVPGLEAVATSSATDLTCYRPVAMTKGVPYHVLGIADSSNQVAESNENNNLKATDGTIQW
jgi:hypothetical protein